MRDPKSILITGASSGIGEAVALIYAAPGITLALGGRDAARTESVAAACREAGADVYPVIHDVTDRAAMEQWIAAADARAPLDLVIANAGIAAGFNGMDQDGAGTRRVFDINIDGVANTVLPALAPMQRRGRGQIALMASLASFIGFPGAPAYCASKAAVRYWGEALRGSLYGDGIEVSVICPGWVHTRMTADNRFHMPLAMSQERAARIIRRGLARNRGRIAFPLALYLMVRLFTALPPALRDPVLRRMPEKE